VRIAGRFGVISLFTQSAARHRRHLAALGLDGALAGDPPVGLGVAAFGADPAATFARLVEVGRCLRDGDGAAAVVLGCTSKGPHRASSQDALTAAVIDPMQTALETAIGTVERLATGRDWA
jgi:Asp/Glu/hydantoin racemase